MKTEERIMPTFEFDRYIDGVLMAEGVKVSTKPDLKSAMPVAAALAAHGTRGQVPVLILRNIDVTTPATPFE